MNNNDAVAALWKRVELREIERLREMNGELVRAAKDLLWGQNRIVQDHWDSLARVVKKAEFERGI